ncbi:putative RNA recognition motif domain, nucleotide-binding alpha-beta plait domain superfamily [Helianthus annuus]|nr:putative RNA recognition motif domain, nucleotide-binding alpha-beta plait domain superfamily [Helianthus annuus]
MAGRDRYKEDTWYDAPTRKGRKSKEDVGLKEKGFAVTKFFVSNLPEGCASSDLYGVLKGFGSIQGTYIARKYDKLGIRFGFVLFVNVKDPVGLERDMKDVWIGSYKLFVVLARFVDGERVVRKDDKRWAPVEEKNGGGRVPVAVEGPVDVGVQNASSQAEGRTFQDTLLGITKEYVLDEIVVEDGFVGNVLRKGWALAGMTRDLEALTSLKQWLAEYDGFLNTKDVWSPVFDSLVVWEGQQFLSDRIAWLSIYGIPLYLFDDRVIELIGSKFGRVVQSAKVDESTDDYSHVTIGILVNTVKRINQLCKLIWRNESCTVLVEEDIGEWIPDCIGADVADGDWEPMNDNRPMDSVASPVHVDVDKMG